MDGYSKETIFHLPGVFMHYPLYSKLLEEIKANPDILKDNVKIGSMFGAPSAIWNGGRAILDEKLKNFEILARIKKMTEEQNIPVRFTFTNCLLTEEHLDDVYCNALLEFFNNGDNEVICNSEILEKYIKEQYGDRYRYISSTTKRIQDKTKQLEEIDKNYYLTVVDYDYNGDIDFLNSIKCKEKCELLCNAVCRPNCTERTLHYEVLSHNQLTGMSGDYCCECSRRSFYMVKNEHNCNFIGAEDIENIYLPMGFKHFKLEGRTAHPLDIIEILIHYIIKDKYALEIRQKMHTCLN